jgi:hypothetical protein
MVLRYFGWGGQDLEPRCPLMPGKPGQAGTSVQPSGRHCSPFPRLSFSTHHHSLALVFSSIAFAHITPLFLLAPPPIPDDTLKIYFVHLGIYPAS